MIKRFLYLAVAIIVLAGCSNDNGPNGQPEGDLGKFLTKTTEGAYSNGSDVIVFSESSHQVAVNPTALTYRIQNDGQTIYLHVKLSEKPKSTGATTSVKIEASGLSISNSIRQMSAEKINGNKIWLWDEEAKLGLIVAF